MAWERMEHQLILKALGTWLMVRIFSAVLRRVGVVRVECHPVWGKSALAWAVAGVSPTLEEGGPLPQLGGVYIPDTLLVGRREYDTGHKLQG